MESVAHVGCVCMSWLMCRMHCKQTPHLSIVIQVVGFKVFQLAARKLFLLLVAQAAQECFLKLLEPQHSRLDVTGQRAAGAAAAAAAGHSIAPPELPW